MGSSSSAPPEEGGTTATPCDTARSRVTAFYPRYTARREHPDSRGSGGGGGASPAATGCWARPRHPRRRDVRRPGEYFGTFHGEGPDRGQHGVVCRPPSEPTE